MKFPQNPKHNPEKALDLIKAAHCSGGRPAEVQHLATARRGWVQNITAEEIAVTRNGKAGYRKRRVNKGPLRESSFLERRLQDQERAFLKLIAGYESYDGAVKRLAKHRPEASRNGVSKRLEKARKLEAAVVNLYLALILPIHQRASVIAMRLGNNGDRISVRRIRQIIKKTARTDEKRK